MGTGRKIQGFAVLVIAASMFGGAAAGDFCLIGGAGIFCGICIFLVGRFLEE